MAHPWVFESAFENRTTPFGWDSESDTGSKLDVPAYWELAQIPGMGMPFRGASCLRIDLRSGDANDHTLTEGDIDIADATTRWFRFYLWLSADFASTANDTFNLLELQQADGTREASLGLRITATTDAVEVGIGDGITPTDFAATTLSKGIWHCIEWGVLISTGGAGTQALYVDGGAAQVSLATLTNAAAVAQGVLGTQDTLSTTTGTILMDQFVMDDAQIYPYRERWPVAVELSQSGHAFIGPGEIESAAILTTTAGNTMKLYDTDSASVLDAEGIIELAIGGHTAFEGPVRFDRGCYVSLGGTSPRGQVLLSLERNGPVYHSSEGLMRQYGLARKERPQNV